MLPPHQPDSPSDKTCLPDKAYHPGASSSSALVWIFGASVRLSGCTPTIFFDHCSLAWRLSVRLEQGKQLLRHPRPDRTTATSDKMRGCAST
ncbi:hypothetical protein GUJ93_ZPchr0009g1132 [Zizania palustris]|uniref:Uncharacterized protein n=1 Tax=Zizania palustris TaxID=103762 RepID=A0A8J5RBV4_ZIZPA|nr:hypothetical protein GUJ93_ZPchr0009g1132 [Zizania palustris]